MADLSHLSPLERLGVHYAAETENVRIRRDNEAIVAANEALPEGATPKSTHEEWTDETYYASRTKGVAFSYAEQHQETMAKDAITKVMTMSQAVQSEVFTALGLNIPALLAAGVSQAEIPQFALQKYLALSREQKDTLVSLVYPDL